MKTQSLRQIFTGVSLAALLVGAWACKTSQSTGPEGAENAAADPGDGMETQGAIDWKSMDGDQKKTHMKKVVMPAMRAVFTEHNAEHFADAKCTLCHGDGAKEGNFEMPNPDLPPFSTDMFDESPEMAAFMKDKVVPAMAEALNLKPYDAATGTGDVGCMTCHPAQE